MRTLRAIAPLFALALLAAAAAPAAAGDSYGESIERDFGVRLSELEDHEQINGEGVRIRAVEHGSAADRSGLRAGDILLEIDGWDIDDVFEARRRISRNEGERVEMRVDRDGQRKVLTAAIPEVRIVHRDRHVVRHRHRVRTGDDFSDLADDMAELGVSIGKMGVGIGEMGAEIGIGVAEAVVEALGVAFDSIDWDEIDRDIEISIDSVDWDQIERDIEDALEELDDLDIHIDLDHLDRIDRDLERKLRRLERRLERIDT